MAALYEYAESGPVSSFSQDVSRASIVFVLQQTETANGLLDDHPDEDDVKYVIQDILGTTTTDPGSGGLRRQTPKRHPYLDYLYASEISSIATIPGDQWRQGFTPSGADLPRVEDWAKYNNYLITVNFALRPFNVLADEDIDEYKIKWYDEDDVEINQRVANEWNRYCDWVPTPREDVIQWTAGEMRLRDTDPLINGAPFMGLPTIYLPNQDILFKWYEVPWRYVISPNSYFRRFRGKINQLPWYGETRQGNFTWPAGSLLYKNFSTEPYVPPWAIEDGFAPVLNSPTKLVNITLSFIETVRTSSTVPPLADIVNRNWIAAGHNLLPSHVDRKYHYATMRPSDEATPPTAENKAKWVPSFLSFPIELLFTDPDA